LAAQQGNKSKTAEVLGIGRKTLHRKLAEWGDLSEAEALEEEDNPSDS
ncbi:MAG: helix-turn-helix domain-containing protein, partial [Breznakiellaceae bacterium]